MFFRALAVFCLGFSFLSAAPAQLTWEMLQQAVPSQQNLLQYDNSPVQIRGFLYRQPTGEMILAKRPNLKSCCVGSPALLDEQIHVQGDSIKNSSRAVTLEGVFKLDPNYNEKGQLARLYLLQNAERIRTGHQFAPWMISILLFIFLAAIGIKKRA